METENRIITVGTLKRPPLFAAAKLFTHLLDMSSITKCELYTPDWRLRARMRTDANYT